MKQIIYIMSDSDSDQDYTIEQSDSGASDCFPVQCSSLRIGGFVVIKNRPCKIVQMSISKTGKHGHAKVHLVGTDIFTEKKYEELCPSTHNMYVPIVKRTEYTLCSIEEEFCSLMDANGDIRDDLKIPESDLGDQIRKGYENGKEISVTVLSAMKEEAIITMRVE
jgi:translation initiation factor 5A